MAERFGAGVCDHSAKADCAEAMAASSCLDVVVWMVARGLPVEGSMEVKVSEGEEVSGCGLPS